MPASSTSHDFSLTLFRGRRFPGVILSDRRRKEDFDSALQAPAAGAACPWLGWRWRESRSIHFPECGRRPGKVGPRRPFSAGRFKKASTNCPWHCASTWSLTARCGYNLTPHDSETNEATPAFSCRSLSICPVFSGSGNKGNRERSAAGGTHVYRPRVLPADCQDSN
jgi:hypothetical protein